MLTNVLYKECMNWLNEVHLFRKGLNHSKDALNQMVAENPRNTSSEEVKKFYTAIHEVGAGLKATEEKILCSLNNGKMFWRGPYENLSSSGHGDVDENELFDLMKTNYNVLIELQRSINRFLSAEA